MEFVATGDFFWCFNPCFFPTFGRHQLVADGIQGSGKLFLSLLTSTHPQAQAALQKLQKNVRFLCESKSSPKKWSCHIAKILQNLRRFVNPRNFVKTWL